MKLPQKTVLFKIHSANPLVLSEFNSLPVQQQVESLCQNSHPNAGAASQGISISTNVPSSSESIAPFSKRYGTLFKDILHTLISRLVQKCHALGKDRCVHIIQKRSLCSHNVSLSIKCILFEKFYAFEVNIARHFIHMVSQKCRAYNHKIMNFETMLPPFNAWIHLFRSKFAHDKALFDSTTVLISISAGLKRMRKRDHTSSRNKILFTYVCLVQKAGVVNKSAQIMGCGVTMWERPMLANQHQADESSCGKTNHF